MDPKTFKQISEKRVEHCLKTLNDKGQEYTRNGDRLWNFKLAAAMIPGQTPEEALRGMMLKHWVSVLDMIQTNDPISVKLMDDKIDDTINYALLLEGLLVERNRRIAIKNDDGLDSHTEVRLKEAWKDSEKRAKVYFKNIPTPTDENKPHGL